MRDIVPFSLRLEDDLHARLQVSADAAGRSLNAEIASRLRASIDASPLPLRDDKAAAADPATAPQVDVELLRRAMRGAQDALAAKKLELPPEKVTLLVSLLYAYFQGGRPVEEREFARFIELLD